MKAQIAHAAFDVVALPLARIKFVATRPGPRPEFPQNPQSELENLVNSSPLTAWVGALKHELEPRITWSAKVRGEMWMVKELHGKICYSGSHLRPMQVIISLVAGFPQRS